MNKERYNQIIDEVYENYCKSFDAQSEIESHSFDTDPMTKIMFVEKIKNFDWFSEKWGLKIEERIVLEQVDQTNPTLKGSTALYSRKLITLTYNNETIESYE
jgi:hypothetical protein